MTMQPLPPSAIFAAECSTTPQASTINDEAAVATAAAVSAPLLELVRNASVECDPHHASSSDAQPHVASASSGPAGLTAARKQLSVTITDELGPSIQSEGYVCEALAKELAPLGTPGVEPPPPDRFMTLVEGDGPTTREMWAKLGCDVMMARAAQEMAKHLDESI